MIRRLSERWGQTSCHRGEKPRLSHESLRLVRFFGHQVQLLNSAGPLGIGVSVVIVIVAALNLILDFDFVETGAHAGAPKYMEWYGAFGIMVTLVWMYLEILRLLAKMRERR
jgi:uncharacterized YccA/Bax inhibitor family protein